MDTQVQDIITAFDRVFAKIGQKPLLENAEFIVDIQLVADFFMRFDSVQKMGRINISFELSSAGVTFYIDRTREMPDIDYDTIQEDVKKFEEIIERIFTSAIRAVYQGDRTVLSFINADNIQVGEHKFSVGMWPNWFRDRVVRSYKPYFGA